MKPKKSLPASLKNRNRVQSIAPTGAVTVGSRIDQANVYRDHYNPVAGLTLRRARSLVDSYPMGEFADLMWTFGCPFSGIESSDPDLLALIARRVSALKEMPWNIRVVDNRRARRKWDEKLAEEQEAALWETYDAIDNLYEAIEHMALATFRGFSHVEKHYGVTGEIYHLEPLDQWNVVRQGSVGAWKYNPLAIQTPFAGLPPSHVLDPLKWIIREESRPVGRFALVKFIRANLSEKDWDAFIEIYGLPGGVVTGPPDIPDGKDGEYRSAAEKIARGGSGYLPHGSEYAANDGPRGSEPFSGRLEYLSQKLVLAGTGGLLTMLSAPGSGTLAGGAHMEAFKTLAAGEARTISELFQRSIDKEILAKRFPGKPVLAYFEVSADEETDPSAVVEDVSKLSAAGYQVDPAQVEEMTRYRVALKPAATPAAEPVQDPSNPPAPSRPLPNRKRKPADPLDELLDDTALDIDEVEAALAKALREGAAEIPTATPRRKKK